MREGNGDGDLLVLWSQGVVKGTGTRGRVAVTTRLEVVEGGVARKETEFR